MAHPDPAALPRQLERTLLACREFERSATGADRRVAWRVTRSFIAALLAEGYAASLIAQCLGVTSGSVSTRGTGSTRIDRSALSAVPRIGAIARSLSAATSKNGWNAGQEVLLDLREYVRLVSQQESPRSSAPFRDSPTDERARAVRGITEGRRRSERVGGAVE